MSNLVGGLAPQAPIPRAEEVKRYLYSNAVLGETRRFRQLDRYEAHYLGTQYQHQTVDWWGMSADQMETVSPEVQVPLGFTQPAIAASVRSKRPTAPTNICKSIVDRFTGLLFGDSRKPDVDWEGDSDTEDFMLAAMEQARFWPKMRESRAIGGATGSVLITAHLRNGRFCLDVYNPKHVQVVWKDRRTFQPLAAFICYRHPVEEADVDPKTGLVQGTKIVMYLYRRIITEFDDTVYKPVRLDPGASVSWEIESEAAHNLGFFPGVWIQNMPVIEQVDGDPDCMGTWQSVDTIDRLVSQMNKAVLLNLDPTLVVGVDPKTISAQGGTIFKGSDHSIMVGQGGSASYLEITGSGVEAGNRIYTMLKQNILDVSRCVMVDPQLLSGSAQSAKAIEYLYAPMIEKADDLRSQYGDLGIVPLLKIMELIARKFDGQSIKLADNKIGRFSFDLAPRINADGARIARALGPGGRIRLKWGPYFAATEDDKQKAVGNIIAAKTGGLIDEETAVKHAAPLFNIQDANAVLEKIRAEAEAQNQSMFGGMGADDAGAVFDEAPADTVMPAAGAGGKP